MMRSTLIMLFALITSMSTSQINLTVAGNIFNATTDSVHVNQIKNGNMIRHFSGPLAKDGTFEVKGTVPNPDYYVLTIGTENINLIVRNEAEIKIYGDGQDLGSFVNIVGAEESSNMHKYIQILKEWQLKSDSATLVLKNDPSKKSLYLVARQS